MSTEELIKVAEFLGLQVIDGTRLINLFYKIIVNLPIYTINIILYCLRINMKVYAKNSFFNY